MAEDGLVTLASAHSVAETIRRFEAALKARDVTLFAEIDHTAGASEAGMTLRPTFLLVFGTARAGTPLMQENQRIGIDLPLKALIFEDADGKVWLAYNEPAWLAARNNLGSAAAGAGAALGKVLAALANDATKA
jgi:uncharacterized protein (DUF302 family)